MHDGHYDRISRGLEMIVSRELSLLFGHVRVAAAEGLKERRSGRASGGQNMTGQYGCGRGRRGTEIMREVCWTTWKMCRCDAECIRERRNHARQSSSRSRSLYWQLDDRDESER